MNLVYRKTAKEASPRPVIAVVPDRIFVGTTRPGSPVSTFIFFSFGFSIFCLCFSFFDFPLLLVVILVRRQIERNTACVCPFRSNTQGNTYMITYTYVSLPVYSMFIFTIVIDSVSRDCYPIPSQFLSAFFLSRKVSRGKSPVCTFRTRLPFVPSFHDLSLASMGVAALQNFPPRPL